MRQQQPPYLGGRHRRAEQIALHLGAAENVQQIPLLIGLDAFRRRRVAGSVAQHPWNARYNLGLAIGYLADVPAPIRDPKSRSYRDRVPCLDLSSAMVNE